MLMATREVLRDHGAIQESTGYLRKLVALAPDVEAKAHYVLEMERS